MKQEHETQSVRKQLDVELAAVNFDEQLQRNVLKQACPPSFWNRELRIPVVAVVAVFCMVIAVPVIGWQQLTSSTTILQPEKVELQPEQDDKIIMLAGGAYYESELLEGWSRAK